MFGILRMECPEKMGDEQQGFPEFPEYIRSVRFSVQYFRIQQYCLDDRFHISSHTFAIVIEDRYDPLYIFGRGVAGHQPLYELSRDKRCCIGMHEEQMQSLVDICFCIPSRRNAFFAQKYLFPRPVMLLFKSDHR